ncbi:S1 family peptidase [methanotrophic endosymbiont of Bathymodiolus puteoserpentis (Logatchev)]|uniref:S1 family peptidase n=1 Tax=methanotrophic endosymbiont of Bathymodiolus puteoserpentis (Logatchev) TaxID=343235 RepID=UPI00157AB529|nr:serine protease [methanotrophic endosymbiont of Bathymodiolus puteoserpentis (Logatchev)]
MKYHLFIKFFFLTTLVFSSLVTGSPSQIMPRIIGGTTSQADLWPWMAGLTPKNASAAAVFCGASLIAKDWVLTAGHCVVGQSPADFDVIINQAQLDADTGERIAVERIVLHPQYNSITLDNDLALIKLKSASQIQPIQLVSPYSNQDAPGKSAFALGWGAVISSGDLFPLDLRQVVLPLVSNTTCSFSMNEDISDDMLCAGDGLGLRDTCSGDSGGPLIVFDSESHTWRQAGITSWGNGCAELGTYGVYTRTKNYAEFISSQICSVQEIPASPSLRLDINANMVGLDWNSGSGVASYRLNYAPYPGAQYIASMDMNLLTHFNADLVSGSAYYVAITSYNNNCLSDYSNIEHFVIP